MADHVPARLMVGWILRSNRLLSEADPRLRLGNELSALT